jgi:hypothetical protein
VSDAPVLLTLDIDWAPDFMIDAVAALFIARGARATWLITHRSAAVDRLRERADLFELGIHPNFREGSTQGATPAEVLRHCLELVPEAVSMRTHSFMQSTPLLTLVAETTPIRVDASLLLPRVAGLRPFEQPFGSSTLVRVPCDWEDDVEMVFPTPRWDARAVLAEPGLRTFNFHPIHIYLNSRDMGPYVAVRSMGLHDAREEDVRPHRSEGEGTGSILRALLEQVDPSRLGLLRDFA